MLGHDPLRSLFEIVSATGTVGLSAGVTDSALAPLLKLALCADMLLGRLEFVALLVLLAKMVEGQDPLEVSAMVKGDARAFLFVVREADARPLGELDLPKETRVVCLYRGGALMLPGNDTSLKRGDEVVLITHVRHPERLAERFGAAANSKPRAETGQGNGGTKP